MRRMTTKQIAGMTLTIEEDYFNWLIKFVYDDGYGDEYSMLLTKLFHTEFYWLNTVPMDDNRVVEGLTLRKEYADYMRISEEDMAIDIPFGCSVLEVLIALARMCERNIMTDSEYGNRTGQWFWTMLSNLGIGNITNKRYDEKYVDDCLNRFMNRTYDYDGTGGIFVVKNPKNDMRKTDLWYQMCWYLDDYLRLNN